jgi:hypothetical protein
MWLLAVALLQVTISGVLGCGETLLHQDFNTFSGPYQYVSDGGCALESYEYSDLVH